MLWVFFFFFSFCSLFVIGLFHFVDPPFFLLVLSLLRFLSLSSVFSFVLMYRLFLLFLVIVSVSFSLLVFLSSLCFVCVCHFAWFFVDLFFFSVAVNTVLNFSFFSFCTFLSFSLIRFANVFYFLSCFDFFFSISSRYTNILRWNGYHTSRQCLAHGVQCYSLSF